MNEVYVNSKMSMPWDGDTFRSPEQAVETLFELQGRRWLSRGLPDSEFLLLPTIDHECPTMSRPAKLSLERQSLELFMSTAHHFASSGERSALNSDFGALMVMRHYGVPTRLLDWSFSPFVAAFFAVETLDEKKRVALEKRDGAIWSFDLTTYEVRGREQWLGWKETTSDRSGDPEKFRAELTAFSADETRNWFICAFYPEGFPRQLAQRGAYSATMQFDRNHADEIASLLIDKSKFRKIKIPALMKRSLRETLCDRFGISRRSLFPDSAGAAEIARSVFPGRKSFIQRVLSARKAIAAGRGVRLEDVPR